VNIAHIISRAIFYHGGLAQIVTFMYATVVQKKRVVCEECQEIFLDDLEVLEKDKLLCKVCRG